MNRQRLGGAVVARCGGCHALWIEAAEVERWIRSRCPVALAASGNSLRGVTTIPTGSCPACGGTMHLGLLHGLSFDHCDRCRGVFLSCSVADLVGRRAEGAGRVGLRDGPPDSTSVPRRGIEAVLEMLSGSFSPW